MSTPADRRLAHARHVAAVADAVDRTSADRADLAELLAAIGAAWAAAIVNPPSLAEQLRWTLVCVAADRIAQRIENEQ